MLALDQALMAEWLARVFWPLCRLSGIFMVAPMLSHGAIPTRVKASLVFLIALALAPTIEVGNPQFVFSYQGIAIACREVLVGLMIGFAMRLVHMAAEVAGGLLGVQSGLAFASVYDHQAGSFGDPLSKFLQLCALMVFVSLNGHLLLIGTVAQSFDTFPLVTGFDFGGGWAKDLLRLSGQMMGFGLLLLMPMLVTLFIVTLLQGVLNRSAPQMNLFSVGFQISMIVALAILVYTLNTFSRGLTSLYERAFSLVHGWLGF
jgi:flagellar biosynthetic protein FliR